MSWALFNAGNTGCWLVADIPRGDVGNAKNKAKKMSDGSMCYARLKPG